MLRQTGSMRSDNTRSPLAVIFFTVFLDLLGFGLVIPILPLYAKTMHASDFQTGVLLAIYSVMQLFFSPILGRLSDRTGRRPILIISILGSCGSQLGYALAPSFGWLLVARGFATACAAPTSPPRRPTSPTSPTRKSRAAGMGESWARRWGSASSSAPGWSWPARPEEVAHAAVLHRQRAGGAQPHPRDRYPARAASRGRADPERTLTWRERLSTAAPRGLHRRGCARS